MTEFKNVRTVTYGDGFSFRLEVCDPENLLRIGTEDCSWEIIKASFEIEKLVLKARDIAKFAHHPEYKEQVNDDKNRLVAAFASAGLDHVFVKEIPNEYWPETYHLERLVNPWYLITTKVGTFKVGWRKRVLNLSWEDTILNVDGNKVFNSNEQTCGNNYVHCSNEADLINALVKLMSHK